MEKAFAARPALLTCDAQRNSGPVAHGRQAGINEIDTEVVGVVFAWICAALYLGSRVPQIIKNVRAPPPLSPRSIDDVGSIIRPTAPRPAVPRDSRPLSRLRVRAGEHCVRQPVTHHDSGSASRFTYVVGGAPVLLSVPCCVTDRLWSGPTEWLR